MNLRRCQNSNAAHGDAHSGARILAADQTVHIASHSLVPTCNASTRKTTIRTSRTAKSALGGDDERLCLDVRGVVFRGMPDLRNKEGPVMSDLLRDLQASVLLEALRKIKELVDDEVDITNSGGPNLAMRITQIADIAMTKVGHSK